MRILSTRRLDTSRAQLLKNNPEMPVKDRRKLEDSVGEDFLESEAERLTKQDLDLDFHYSSKFVDDFSVFQRSGRQLMYPLLGATAGAALGLGWSAASGMPAPLAFGFFGLVGAGSLTMMALNPSPEELEVNHDDPAHTRGMLEKYSRSRAEREDQELSETIAKSKETLENLSVSKRDEWEADAGLMTSRETLASQLDQTLELQLSSKINHLRLDLLEVKEQGLALLERLSTNSGELTKQDLMEIVKFRQQIAASPGERFQLTASEKLLEQAPGSTLSESQAETQKQAGKRKLYNGIKKWTLPAMVAAGAVGGYVFGSSLGGWQATGLGLLGGATAAFPVHAALDLASVKSLPAYRDEKAQRLLSHHMETTDDFTVTGLVSHMRKELGSWTDDINALREMAEGRPELLKSLDEAEETSTAIEGMIGELRSSRDHVKQENLSGELRELLDALTTEEAQNQGRLEVAKIGAV